jgi:Flp pilus assembly protein TadG
MKRLNRMKNDERGFSLVFVALGFMGFLAASMLAIDVGMLMTARNQAQNSADAGALAGATALAFNSYDDRTDAGPAKMNAMAAATGNKVMRYNVSVKPSDVTFPLGPTGLNNRVQVNVFRTAARAGANGKDGDGGPVATLIAAIFKMDSADVSATATAEASPANAETCVKPFTIPDRWKEMQDPGGWDPLVSTFDLAAGGGKKGAPAGTDDVYIGPEDKDNYTGYNAERDKGLEIILKSDNATKVSPSIYNPYVIPGSKGASDYRWNIGNCNTTMMHPGDLFQPEPGNMVGPTKQGMDDLIAKDPNAYWDTANKRVVSTMQPSPRVVIIPLYDPMYYETGKQTGRNASLKVVNYLGFFVEEMQGNQVRGRVTPIGGVIDKNAGPAPPAIFPMVIRLVK